MTEKKKQIENYIFKEIKSDFNLNGYNDQEIKDSISLFFQFLLCNNEVDPNFKRWNQFDDTFVDKFSKYFENPSNNSSDVHSLLKSVEPILGKLLYLIKKKEFLELLNKRDYLGLGAYINNLDLNPKIWIKDSNNDYNLAESDTNEEKMSDINWKHFAINIPSKIEKIRSGECKLTNTIEDEKKFVRHIITTILVKNCESHDYNKYSNSQRVEYFTSFLITLIYTTFKWKDEIQQEINKIPFLESSRINHTDYLNGIIQKHQIIAEKYVELYLEENQDIGRDTITLRSGKICDVLDKLHENRMVIWSGAGMGKTSSLIYLVYTEAKNRLKSRENFAIPVFLELNKLDAEKTLKDIIKTRLKVDNNQLDQLFASNQIKLYIDALNEIRTIDEQLRSQRYREIDEIQKEYKDLFLIVTNRPPEDGIPIIGGIPVFHLKPLTEEGIEELIHKYCTENNILNQDLINKVNYTISSNSRLKKIIQCPFLLVTIINLTKNGTEIKANEYLIIHSFINELFRREKQEKMDERLDVRKVQELLKYFAFKIYEKYKNSSSVSSKDAEEIFNQCNDERNLDYDTGYALYKLAIPLGILEMAKEDYKETIGFAHAKYQEYFKALYDDDQE
tara:strand:+ start:1628 stop:3484 length:1857 start_codon:yes stop_codon:yes gene_type:complete